MKIRRAPFRLLFPAAVVIGLLASTAVAENWPRFRGPNGQGISGEKGIPVEWSENDLSWKIELAGTGHSSPVVWDDKVFITFADTDEDEKTTKCTLMAVRASDGGVLWQKDYTVEPAEMNPLNSSAASTPAVDADGVYAIWFEANRTVVTAVDHQGEEKWTKEFAPARIGHGPGTSPIVHEDTVVFTLEQEEEEDEEDDEENDERDESNEILPSYWYALDRRSGEIRWQLERPNGAQGSSSTPCVYSSQNGRELLAFSSSGHGITVVDLESGGVVWEEESVFPTRVVSSPVLAGDVIVGTCGRGGSGVQLAAVRPSAEGASQARVLYTLKEKFVPNVPTPVALDKWLFLFHDGGLVTCLESETGNVLWSEKPGGRFFGSPVLIEDRLYCINMKGQVVVLRAADKYERLAVNDLGEASQSTPAIADGRMILRTISHLYCIVGEQGQ